MDESDHRNDDDRRIALEARDWIVRLTSGDVGEADLDRFNAWRGLSEAHRNAFDRERLFWQQLQALEGEAAPATRRPGGAALTAGIGRRRFFIGAGAGLAAAGGALLAPRLQLWWNAAHATGIGEQAEIALPDGSVAFLNTDSAIAVEFTPRLRLVSLLKGEAEFRAGGERLPPFRVAALGANSDAAEALFSVRLAGDTAAVTVAEGLVHVSGPASPRDETAGGGAIAVAAGERTQYARGGFPSHAAKIDLDAALAWRSGRVIFEGEPFAAAIAELGRYIPEPVILRPGVAGDNPVSAIFSTREALAALRALAQTQGLSVYRVPGVMLLVS